MNRSIQKYIDKKMMFMTDRNTRLSSNLNIKQNKMANKEDSSHQIEYMLPSKKERSNNNNHASGSVNFELNK